MKNGWKQEETLPDGHRLFSKRTDDGVKYAIADDSGATPEDTDDGILWLDSSRCLILDRDESFDPPREFMMIPLIDDNGKQTRTPCNVSTLLHLANTMDWYVEDVNRKVIYEVH